jgi:hypothetical protein
MRFPTTLTLEVYGTTFDVYVSFSSRKTFQVATPAGFRTIAKRDCKGVDNSDAILAAWKASRA